MLFAGIDSLVYQIETDDVYEDFYEDKSLFDFSNYPKDSRFYGPVDKKVIGKMKDEVMGNIIGELVGLKSKMYSLDDKEIKKAKGVNKNIVDSIRQGMCDVLFGKGLMREIMQRIQIFSKFLCHFLMINVIFLMIVLIVWLTSIKTY